MTDYEHVQRLRTLLHTLGHQEPQITCAEVAHEAQDSTVPNEREAATLLLDAATLYRLAGDRLRQAFLLLESHAKRL